MYSLVPEGEYRLGVSEGQLQGLTRDGLRFYTNRGVRVVFIRRFWIRTHPVTLKEYLDFLHQSDRKLNHPLVNTRSGLKKPVVNVSHLEAKEFCAWIGGRLPTAYEWEVSALGVDSASTRDCIPKKLEPIGKHPELRSQFGVQELIGSVGEWTSDVWDGRAIVKGSPFNANVLSVHDEAAYDCATRHFNVGFRYVLV